jgi:hypothetical protein
MAKYGNVHMLYYIVWYIPFYFSSLNNYHSPVMGKFELYVEAPKEAPQVRNTATCRETRR